MNVRLKELRSRLNLSQEAFGNSIGFEKGHVSAMEKGSRTITDRTISDICRIYNVSEDWFRYGIGEMFAIKVDSVIAELEEKFSMGDVFKKFVIAYLELDELAKREIDRFMDNIVEAVQKEKEKKV